MRCPACNAENLEGAVTCASCRAALSGAAAPAAAAEQPAPQEAAVAPGRRRLSKLAVFAIVAAGIAPWLQVLSMESGGSWLGAAAANNWVVLMGLEYGAYALFAFAIIASLFALAHVLGRQRRRGGALAVGGLLLAVGGMAGNVYGPTLGGRAGELLAAMGGGTGHYAWQTAANIAGAAVVCEIVLLFVGGRAPAPAPEPAEAEPAKTA
jgi:MFS family permease